MRLALIVAIFLSLQGCASLPPIMQRWADLDIARFSIYCLEGSDESYLFTEGGVAQLPVPLNEVLSNARQVLWRVRGAWLEIDTSNDGTFKRRLRVVALYPANKRLIAEDPSGKRSVWGYTSMRFPPSFVPERPRPGYWQP